MTVLRYLEEPHLLSCSIEFNKAILLEDGRTSVIAPSTIFYPQGGGQPFDTGLIVGPNLSFQVEEVRMIDGEVHHIGNIKKGDLPEAGNSLHFTIDQERRALHNGLHTAGHLVDAAMYNAGFRFEPSKGYHFPDSPYVEYIGSIPAEEREAAINTLNAELSKLILEDSEVLYRTEQSKEGLKKDCLYIPDYLPEGKPIRVVTVAGWGCACGGTHVKSTGELKGMRIKKLKVKKGFLRVSYSLD